MNFVNANHCCSVTKSRLLLCDPMDCSMPGSLSFTISWSLLRFMSIELLMPSNRLILCCSLFHHTPVILTTI